MADKPIKVLSVCTSDSSGGAARAAYRIHQAVKPWGVDSQMFVKNKGTHDSDVLSVQEFLPKNPLYKAFDWARNKIKNKWQHYLWEKYPQRSGDFMSDLRSTDIGDALRKIDYDVLHLHWVNLRFLPLDKLPKDKPIVWTLHDSWPFCGVCHYFFDCERYRHQCGACPSLNSLTENDLSRQVWKKKAKLYKGLDLHIIAPSQWLASCARQSSLLGRFPLEVIPNCIETDIFRPLSETEISPRWRNFQEKRFEKPFLLYGAMNAATDKIKGFSNLLSALQMLENKIDAPDFDLIVFGAKEGELDMDIHRPIHYVGYVGDTDELVSLYNLASVMVVPSLTENLSCTIMESLSCGTPVVAFQIGGNGDMIDHQQNGYLAREKDNEDLAKGILWCLKNNQDGHLSRNARQKVLKNYTPEIVGKKYSELYKKSFENNSNQVSF